jgi:hypothetical protein
VKEFLEIFQFARDNNIIAPALVAVYVAVIVFRLFDLNRYYMAMLMERVDDVLFSRQRASTERFEAYLRAEGLYDEDLLLAFRSMLHSALFTRTRERIKLAIHRNGFYKKKGKKLTAYIHLIGERLYYKNQSDMMSDALHLGALIRASNSTRCTLEEAIADWGDIVTYAKRLRLELTGDFLKLLFFWGVQKDR